MVIHSNLLHTEDERLKILLRRIYSHDSTLRGGCTGRIRDLSKVAQPDSKPATSSAATIASRVVSLLLALRSLPDKTALHAQ